MATAHVLLHIFSVRFSSNLNPNSLPSAPLDPYLVSPTSRLFPSSSSLQLPPSAVFDIVQRNSPKRASRVSSEGGGGGGLPRELVEDSKFVPLNADDPRFGPPALLLLGFAVEEATMIQKLLKDLDGEFLQIIYCTEDMISCSLLEAMNTRQQSLDNVKIAKLVPRICFLSGLSGEEIMMFIDAFQETGLEPAAFAALVPNSADKPLQELIEEVMGDHEMLVSHSAKQPGSALG
ncbi:hypothetical protein Nepgr_001277 [Nepenthes gracilis]|uniref:Uncharacterized protein n=1 Tax=Nepenthes gracilis TaxID=150966 RepID=A0AAD3P6U3_NEPGR|nr:hypothetical protein Nepgr_001277 [Nepenthes gracilis]